MVENRIPADEITSAEPWFVPVLGVNGAIVSSREKELKDGKNEKIEDLSAYVQNGRLSREVLEEVYRQAHDEGVSKGQAQGYQSGHEQGFAKGQQEGYNAGIKQAQTELVNDMQYLQNLLQNLLGSLGEQNTVVESWLFSLVTQVCEALAVKECENNEQYILNAVKQGVAALPVGTEHIELLLNPEDLTSINKYAQENSLPWEIKSDSCLTRGSCKVKMRYSTIDFSIANRVKQALLSLQTSIEGAAGQSRLEPEESGLSQVEARPDNDDNTFHH